MFSLPPPTPSLAVPVLCYRRQVPVPSPLGQPSIGVRAGVGVADAAVYMVGGDLTYPVSVGIHLFSVRVDGDYWRHISSGNGGGVGVSLCGLFGLGAMYAGGGICYASRFGGAAGPEGAGIKLFVGNHLALGLGIEGDLITTSKGSLASAMLAYHF